VHASTTDDPALVEEFRSDRESGKRPFAREKAIPELQDGMSVFASLDAARDRWQEMHEIATQRGQAVRAGHHIAAVELTPECGFSLEDLNEPDQHLTMWGEKSRLAGAVVRIYPAGIPNP
jgi:hypothetical protein